VSDGNASGLGDRLLLRFRLDPQRPYRSAKGWLRIA
jgi:hypothetical protein